jgi:hypothetical protein
MIPQLAYNLYDIADHALPSRFKPTDLALLTLDQIKEALSMILPTDAARQAAPQLAQSLLDLTTAMAATEALVLGDPDALNKV